MAYLVLLFAIIPVRVLKGETNYFLVGRVPPVKADSYVLPLSKQEDIGYARYIISLGESIRTNESAKPIVAAYLAAGNDGINRDYMDPKFRQWSWHVAQFIEFYQASAEIYDGA